ncbi:MAG: DUF3168 domain-containing protein [Enterobacteriaceae bacterium]|jgi:hypothetical protein|nr:DUF3168 domain-containing protein [Enterobacteriaceae bacterium]TCW50786.1 uncharacterized protein DUF3168 [Phytobacter diazotrophicus]
MKESDVFHLIGSLANGQVYMDIVPLNDAGKPAVVPPWITFTFVSQSYGDTFCSPAEETTFVQVDVYSRSVEESRELREQVVIALTPLQFTRMSKTGGYEPDTKLRRATLEISVQQ